MARSSVSGTDGGTGTEGALSGSGNNSGVRFNQVQREEPAAVVLTPQVDPALRRRRIVFVALAVAAALLLLLVSRNRLGVQTDGGPTSNRSFQPPPREIQ